MEAQRILHERGGVLIFVALLISVIVGFLALSIDVGIYATELGNRERTAENAALSSLKTYVDSQGEKPRPAYKDSYEVALTRSQQIFRLNMENFLSSGFRGSSASDLWVVDDLNGQGTRLEPGTWLPDIPGDPTNQAARNSCSPPAVAGKGCFAKGSKNQSANAFHTVFETPAALPLRLFFWAGLLPEHHWHVRSEAYATLQPRRAVFLLDLSPSVVEDTHRSNAALGLKSEFAYELDLTNGGGCSDGNNPSSSLQIGSRARNTWDNLPSGSRPPTALPTQHYKGDFECLTLPTSLTAIGEPRYAVDNEVDPEPLTGILKSVNTALEMFRRRGVAEDRVAISAFDDGFLTERNLEISLPTPPGAPERMRQPISSDSRFSDFLDVYTNMTKTVAQRSDAYLFPRAFGSRSFVDSSGTVVRLPSATNIKMALDEANTLITSSPSYRTSSNFVVLFTDGLSNCPSNPPIAGYGCYYSTSSPSSLSMSQTYVELAVDEVTADSFIQKFRESGTLVHIVMFGQQTGAHTLLRKKGDHCMTDDEARMNVPQTTFVDANGGTVDPSDSQPLFYPNKLYRIAQGTGGSYLPIRPVCRSDGVPIDLKPKCAAASNDGDLIKNLKACSDTSNPVCLTVVTDNNGRLLCDPQNRTPEKQIADAMQEMLASPYMLVKPD